MYIAEANSMNSVQETNEKFCWVAGRKTTTIYKFMLYFQIAVLTRFRPFTIVFVKRIKERREKSICKSLKL